MEHDKATYFSEIETDAAKGFTILDTDEERERYHVAEKWLASQDDESSQSEDKWVDYWIDASDLQRRLSEGACEKVGDLTDEQFAAVCSKTGYETEGKTLVHA